MDYHKSNYLVDKNTNSEYHSSHLTRHSHPTVQPQHHAIQHYVLDTLSDELCELVWLAGTHFFDLASTLGQHKGGRGRNNSQGNSITLVKLARTFSLIIAVILESKILGATVTTLIPYRARSLVNGKVNERMAPLEAEYATWPG